MSRIRKSASTSLPSARISKSSSRAATCLTATSNLICIRSSSRRDDSRRGRNLLLFERIAKQLDELPHDEFPLVASRLQRVLKHGQVLWTTDHVHLQSLYGRGFAHAVMCGLVRADRIRHPDTSAP